MPNRQARGEDGSIAVEFALAAPLLLLIIVFLLESGWALYQYSRLNKNLFFASELSSVAVRPLSAADRTRIENAVRTGQPSGGTNLPLGWEAANAIAVTDAALSIGGESVPLTTVEAHVPHRFLLPALTANLLIDGLTFDAAQTQRRRD